MATIAERINKRLTVIRENTEDVSWKDPSNPNYDRQMAEDALFHTIGPLTDTSRWISKWSSPGTPPPGFAPGGPAPKWTENEIVIAYAGDPRLLFRPGGRDHPSSPAYGTRGGAPLYRTALRTARTFRRERDQSFIEELYQNGFVELTKLMKPGFDQGKSPFISFVAANVEGAMVNGTSGSGEEAIKARGDVAKDSGLIGLQGLLKAKSPEEARKVADQIKGKYREGKFHDKHSDNPFGGYSQRVHLLSNNLAAALENGDPEIVADVKAEIEELLQKIEDDKGMVLGAGTGIGQAVSNQDRKTKVGVHSMDMPVGGDGTGTMGDNLSNRDDYPVESSEVAEAITFVLKIALEHDMGAAIGSNPKFMEMATQFGLKPGEKLGGPLSAAEYRCVLRKLGVSANQYPGKGQMRAALTVPRDAKGWWSPGEDPEIEKIPAGGAWKSIWSREGYQELENTDIMREFTQEYREFGQLGIRGVAAREAAATAGKEVLSKVSIGHAVNSALMKVKLIGHIHRSQVGYGGVDESVVRGLRTAGVPLMEDYDPIDRRLINEAFDFVIRKLTRSVVLESNLPDDSKRRALEEAAVGVVWSR